MSDKAQLEVKVGRPADLGVVATFFDRTAYSARRVGDDMLLVRPPGELDCRIMRREVALYLGLIERRHPGVGVSLGDCRET